jgi:hypothetical protein
MKAFKKFYLSVLTFIIVILVTGTVSYAWFTYRTINNIDGLSLGASAGDDLELSIDGINFSNILLTSELTDIFSDITLNAVTTSDNINFTTGGVYGTNPAFAGEHYLSFDLWIRTTRAERSIYLFNNVNDQVTFQDSKPGTFVKSRGIYWIANETFQNGVMQSDIVSKGSINRYYASDAIRIGVKELIDDTNPLDVRDESELKNLIYDPSENENRGFGQPFGAFSYFFNRTLIYLYLPDVFPETTYRLSQMDRNNPYQAIDNHSLVANLQETTQVDDKNKVYYQAKVRINIWIEGWDPDSLDAIDKDIVRIQIQFKAAHAFQE